MTVRMSLPAWFDYVGKTFFLCEVQFKTFCPSAGTICPPTENVHEMPERLTIMLVNPITSNSPQPTPFQV